jgi:hypothetical protein
VRLSVLGDDGNNLSQDAGSARQLVLGDPIATSHDKKSIFVVRLAKEIGVSYPLRG